MIFGKIIRLNLFVEKPTPPSLSERYGSLTSFVVEGYSFIQFMLKSSLHLSICAGILMMAAVSCKKSTAQSPTPPDTSGTGLIDPASLKGTLVFQSGFEPSCQIIPNGTNGTDRIIGKDATLASNNDWDALETSVLSSRPYFNYNGGDSVKRAARLATDPTNTSNRVLHYRLSDHWPDGGNGSVKARVQYEFYNIKTGYKEYYQSVRMFLPSSFDLLKKYPSSINWLTIVEIWNNITWNQTVPNRYRLTLGIGKLVPSESDLCFIVEGQDCLLNPDGSQKYTTLWSQQAPQVKLPVGKWFTMEYYFKEGNRQQGRFYMTIQPEGGQRQLVFDITNFTHNSADPAPDGVTHFNPMKLYTSKELVDYMKAQGQSLNIYWDDLRIWKK